MARPTISFCMIARDEAQFIGDCLESVRGAVDELIVVDTGSRDGTQDLARRAGAFVYSFPWCDDFAAARNASIQHASGDWVLWLDADERLMPGGAQVIREAVARDDLDCGLLVLHNASRLDASPEEVLSGSARILEPVMQRRLVRRTPDLLFYGAVHEHLGPWLEKGARRARGLPAHVIHLGYAAEVRQARGKAVRNLRLLERQVELDPSDFATYGYLAHSYLLAGRLDDAWGAAEQGWAIVQGMDLADQLLVIRSVVHLAAVRAHMQLFRGAPSGAIETVDRAEAIHGPAPDFDFFRGEAYATLARSSKPWAERLNDLERADRAYGAAIEKNDWLVTVRYLGGASGYRAWAGLGFVAMQRGDFARALECFDAALDEAPEWLDAQLGRARALVALGDQERLFALVDELEGTDLVWLIAAAVAEYLGAVDDFAEYLERARESANRGVANENWIEDLGMRYGHLLAYLGTPRPGPGATGAACALMAGREPERPPADLSPWEQSDLTLLVRNLFRLGRVELIGALTGPQTEAALPGIGALVASVAQESQGWRANSVPA